MQAVQWRLDGAQMVRHAKSVETLEQRYADAGLSCDYYTPAVHKGAFALPGYILKLLP